MYREKTIAAVVPAYNEEHLIGRVIETMPDYVDRIVVIDDNSTDKTREIVEGLRKEDKRVELITHESNTGVGTAIGSGYKWCRDKGIDVAVVLAGDAQMDPDDMPGLLDPVVEELADYAKGNRLFTGEAWQIIPRARYLGNATLSLLTKIASGYWHVADSQTGYTAIGKHALHTLPLDSIYPRYGMPNDFLVTLNIYNMRVIDVPVKPVYGIGEKSGIKIGRIGFQLAPLLVRLFFRRMIQKYVIRDFHPLVFFYLFGCFVLMLDVFFVIQFFWLWARHGTVPPITALAVLFCTITGLQSVLFAMLFDMEANRDLKGGRCCPPDTVPHP